MGFYSFSTAKIAQKLKLGMAQNVVLFDSHNRRAKLLYNKKKIATLGVNGKWTLRHFSILSVHSKRFIKAGTIPESDHSVSNI